MARDCWFKGKGKGKGIHGLDNDYHEYGEPQDIDISGFEIMMVEAENWKEVQKRGKTGRKPLNMAKVKHQNKFSVLVDSDDDAVFSDDLGDEQCHDEEIGDTKLAKTKYEMFYGLPAGSATIEQVICSSAGIQGWAAANLSNQQGHEPVGTCHCKGFDADRQRDMSIMGLEAQDMKQKKMKSIGFGRITVDSGAAESVMPTKMLQRVPIKRSPEDKMNARYTAADGGHMYNEGQRQIHFKANGDNSINSAEFQCTSVKKPLASVSRIVDKGNRVVFEPGGSFIQNIATGKKIELIRDRGTFAMEVEYVMEDEEENQGQGFTRPS